MQKTIDVITLFRTAVETHTTHSAAGVDELVARLLDGIGWVDWLETMRGVHWDRETKSGYPVGVSLGSIVRDLLIMEPGIGDYSHALKIGEQFDRDIETAAALQVNGVRFVRSQSGISARVLREYKEEEAAFHAAAELGDRGLRFAYCADLADLGKQ